MKMIGNRFFFPILLNAIAICCSGASDTNLFFFSDAEPPPSREIEYGQVIGFIEYIGTNETDRVAATYKGGDTLEFSNGIDLTVSHLSIKYIIKKMDDTLEFMNMPDSASGSPGYSADKIYAYMQWRRADLERKGFERKWYIIKNESNHGLESTSAPPAAGTLETHP